MLTSDGHPVHYTTEYYPRDREWEDDGWRRTSLAIPDPAIVLCLDGTHALRFFDGKSTMQRGFKTYEAADAARRKA